MTLPKSNTAFVEDVDTIPDSNEIVQEYKDLNDKCEAVLDKINKRKRNSNSKLKK